ncbi:cytochrome P450 94A1-like [Dioscorea cayenensis subsp. rotundata]|uniref:Cytochrome P450 94A1-like n=1 Tax=Dioscorea cayennensis subsp. rotundata TaxID=55577 RepID=A0AB40CC52_DIOCR|nr:cytochrome P450 94A1-like [Dioscorea cayenensis subsp. rotundata]
METLTLITILLFLLLILLTILRRRRHSPVTRTQNQSGSFLELMKNSHRILDWTTDLLLSNPSGTVSTFMAIITSNPSNVEHILKTNFNNYPKGSSFTSILHDFLGSGIFNADGDHWRLQRKTASLEFSTKAIRAFILSRVHLESISRLLPLLTSASVSGEIINLQDLLELFTFDNACQVTFGHDPSLLNASSPSFSDRELALAFEEATQLSVRRFSHPFPFIWKLQRFLNLGSERRLREEVAKVQAFAMEVVLERKRRRDLTGSLGDDLLSRFIAVDNDYSDEFLRDIIISFVLAGRDTTAAAITWFFWLISTRPDVKEKIIDEIKSVRAKTKKTMDEAPVFSLDQVKDMVYLHAALAESLRLYPPVPLQTRTSLEDDVLPDGTAVKKGQTVMYSSYAMGRRKEIWGPEWGDFRPERWIEKGEFRAVSPFTYPVFHAGPRMCLGKEMAHIQMKAIAAAVLERFEIEVVDGEKERVKDLGIMLRIKGGLPVRVHPLVY